MKFSICIPAYNRARHLAPLLTSILEQGFKDYEIIVCEDVSRERAQIREIATAFRSNGAPIQYYENEVNLGYDGNIRQLVAKSTGHYCFFMGNDDLMKPGALNVVDSAISRNPGVGVVIKGYEWFISDPGDIRQVIRYVSKETLVSAGEPAIVAAFRRVGVISGFVVHRADAAGAAESKFDGSLYYQMYIAGSVLARRDALFTPEILVSCRGEEPPDFGSSEAERGKYVPGRYTPEARINMISSVFEIAEHLQESTGIPVKNRIIRDYAYYFYPYIRDQLNLPLRDYFRMYRSFGRLGLDQYAIFHGYILASYVLGESGVDRLSTLARRMLGRSPQLGGALGSD